MRRDDRQAGGVAPQDLKALAAQLDMRGVSSLKKADLIDRIVSHTIDYRLNSNAIRRL